MATWKRLEEYAPFVRPLVAHMWEARPPLSPSQFAAAAGLRRQLLSTWLNSPADAVIAPEPRVLVRLARALGRPVSELFARAGHADADDRLMDRAGALAPDEREALARALVALQGRQGRQERDATHPARPDGPVPAEEGSRPAAPPPDDSRVGGAAGASAARTAGARHTSDLSDGRDGR